MRNRLAYFLPVLDYLGALFWVFGILILTPLAVQIAYARAGFREVSPVCFVLPAAISLCLGFLLKHRATFKPLNSRTSMLLCAIGWIAVSALGAIPFWWALQCGYLDAFFESVSGFTTTGITMLQGLDAMPRSILFWRSLIQWIGGLGILTFFLAVVFTARSAHSLFSAESHKIVSKRPVPGLFHTLRILWAIYAAFTALAIALLVIQGMSLYDAACHSFTAISTGGYSTHDASIDYYRQAGYRNFAGIEATLTFVMLLGGMNFLVHYRVLTGSLRGLWDNLEMRLWWGLLFGATFLVGLDHWMKAHADSLLDTVRYSLFQVVAIITTTGFATKDINTEYFPALSKLIFLVLMVIGGCVGSTGGGIKVLRIGILCQMVRRQVRHVIHGRAAVQPVLVDGSAVDSEELRRVAALFFAWVVLLFVGGGITALFADFGKADSGMVAWKSASGMFSALGNIGPCYISVPEMSGLHAVVKITYIIGMLAGRLEILPILLLFTRRTWR